jgi:hypothetical protein
MLSAESAISRLRRDLTLGAAVKLLLAAAFLGVLVLRPLVAPRLDPTLALVLIGFVWLSLSLASAKGSRLAAGSSALIASGQYDEAERVIDQALRSFSLFRAVKLQTLHHLALLRHSQRRWRESALLCRALLRQRLGTLQGLSKPSRLMLADAMLELNDLGGAYDALSGLYTQRLSLAELLNLMAVQLDYESRVGAWERMVDRVMHKVQLAELMPSGTAARSQALLALASKKTGRKDWSDWLRRRAELLADPLKLKSDRPLLAELWP